MFTKKQKRQLLKFPVHYDLVDIMRVDPPIVVADVESMQSFWTEDKVHALLSENLELLARNTITLDQLVTNAQSSLAMYTDMCREDNMCSDLKLMRAMVATTYQLVRNLVNVGPRMRIDVSECCHEYYTAVDLEFYE